MIGPAPHLPHVEPFTRINLFTGAAQAVLVLRGGAAVPDVLLSNCAGFGTTSGGHAEKSDQLQNLELERAQLS